MDNPRGPGEGLEEGEDDESSRPLTRERVAQIIRFPLILSAAGIVNVGAMLPQLAKMMEEKKADGISLTMISIFLLVQLAYAGEGYFKHSKSQLIPMLLSAGVSASTIAYVCYLRSCN